MDVYEHRLTLLDCEYQHKLTGLIMLKKSNSNISSLVEAPDDEVNFIQARNLMHDATCV